MRPEFHRLFHYFYYNDTSFRMLKANVHYIWWGTSRCILYIWPSDFTLHSSLWWEYLKNTGQYWIIYFSFFTISLPMKPSILILLCIFHIYFHFSVDRTWFFYQDSVVIIFFVHLSSLMLRYMQFNLQNGKWNICLVRKLKRIGHFYGVSFNCDIMWLYTKLSRLYFFKET